MAACLRLVFTGRRSVLGGERAPCQHRGDRVEDPPGGCGGVLVIVEQGAVRRPVDDAVHAVGRQRGKGFLRGITTGVSENPVRGRDEPAPSEGGSIPNRRSPNSGAGWSESDGRAGSDHGARQIFGQRAGVRCGRMPLLDPASEGLQVPGGVETAQPDGRSCDASARGADRDGADSAVGASLQARRAEEYATPGSGDSGCEAGVT